MSDIPVRAASTVVLLRDRTSPKEAGHAALELLLVRRNRALAFAGGFWVFPGGAIDAADREAAAGDDDEAARIAAAREAHEEAGVVTDPKDMVLVSHWTTPKEERKRFSTWIFAGSIASDAEVEIDGSEIHDYQWIGAQEALRKHEQGDLPLMPPTYITLCAIARYADAPSALEGERNTPCPRVLPRMVPVEGEGGFATLYLGDSGYDDGNMDRPGPRHRAFLQDGSWRYQYEDVEDELPLYPIDGVMSSFMDEDSIKDNEATRFPLWDWPVRIIHWLIVGILPAMWWTAEEGYLDIHAYLGQTLLVAVVTRLVWGFVGSVHARFKDFVRGPSAVLAYFQGAPASTPGHNPAGGWSALTLWCLLLAQALTGLVNSDDVLFTGPFHYLFESDVTDLVSSFHEPLFKVLLGFVALHVLTIVFYERRKDQRLLRPMLTGRTAERFGSARAQPLYKALIIAAVLTAGLCIAISQAPAPPPSYW